LELTDGVSEGIPQTVAFTIWSVPVQAPNADIVHQIHKRPEVFCNAGSLQNGIFGNPQVLVFTLAANFRSLRMNSGCFAALWRYINWRDNDW
jgi:hypothetical protein